MLYSALQGHVPLTCHLPSFDLHLDYTSSKMTIECMWRDSRPPPIPPTPSDSGPRSWRLAYTRWC